MAGCDCSQGLKFDGMSAGFRRALWHVIAINAALFTVETVAGAYAGSQALKADALDFLGDTLTYAVSLWVIGKPLKLRATAALVKGISLSAMGAFVFATTAYQVVILGIPNAPVMGVIGFLALAANIASVLILRHHQQGDANVRSVWLCSRNDAIGNIAVLAAAGLVFLTDSAWPDLAVATLMAGLFLWSAVQIITQALQERRADSQSNSAGGCRYRPPLKGRL